MRRLRRFGYATAAAMVAVVAYIVLTLPPPARRLTPGPPGTIIGAYHVHSERSDGSGTRDQIAAAAARAGLQFVVVTDHGDGTRAPEPPQYRHAVLIIDGVEIGTTTGHLVALGLTAPAPYPLGGEARDVAEDVQRLHGWTMAAHPDSPRKGLRWGGGVDVTGIEWINADSEWRDEPIARLLMAGGRYLVRPSETIASLFDRPTAPLRTWDRLSLTRNTVGLGAVDAHARIGIDDAGTSGRGSTILARPGYEDLFRTLVQAVELQASLSGDPGKDAETILGQIRAGHTYSVVRAFADPGRVAFTASSGDEVRMMGDSLETEADVVVSASVQEPADARVDIVKDGEVVASGTGQATVVHQGPLAVYRTEVFLPEHRSPWIMTNAIRVGVPAPAIPVSIVPAPAIPLMALDTQTAWTVEKQQASDADLVRENGEVGLAFRLAPGPSVGQYAAMVYPVAGAQAFESVTLSIRTSTPMRVSLQVRQPTGNDGARWHRSVYCDATLRTITIPLSDFTPTEASSARRSNPTAVRSFLIVVDTVHTRPGSAGTVWVSGVSLGSGSTSAPTSAR